MRLALDNGEVLSSKEDIHAVQNQASTEIASAYL
jgi:hypothetical protein